jgi:transposase
MAEPLVTDALWALIAPLLPERPGRPKGGRPPPDDRMVLEGIIFVLCTGIPWASLPKQMGCGSGMTCWRRLREWQAAGVWGGCTGPCSTGSAGRTRSISGDARSTAPPSSRRKRGERVGPNPTDRGKPGTKRHVLVDAGGIPLALVLTPANAHDSTVLEPVLDAVPPIRQCAGPTLWSRRTKRSG